MRDLGVNGVRSSPGRLRVVLFMQLLLSGFGGLLMAGMAL